MQDRIGGRQQIDVAELGARGPAHALTFTTMYVAGPALDTPDMQPNGSRPQSMGEPDDRFAHAIVNTDFLGQLTLQGVLHGLARLLLATGKLPAAGTGGSRTPLRNQKSAVRRHEHADGDVQNIVSFGAGVHACVFCGA